MKYEMTIPLHKVTLSNGVTFIREESEDVLKTVEVQIANAETSLRCIKEQVQAESQMLHKLKIDRDELISLLLDK